MPMFLKQLYKHSKLLFLLVIVFICGQLFINIKRGLVFSPFYHYGMYSHVMKPEDEYLIPEIIVNGSRIKGSDFTPWTWDKINQPITYFKGIPASNALYNNEVKRLTPSFLSTQKTNNFLQACDYKTFLEWYKNYLADVLGKPVRTVDIAYRNFRFNKGKLEPTSTTFTLTGLCQ